MKFTPDEQVLIDQLGADIRDDYASASAPQCGARLILARSVFPNGDDWERWVDTVCGIPAHRAASLVKIARAHMAARAREELQLGHEYVVALGL